MLNSVIRTNNKCYPQILLEECKYETKKNKMENLINALDPSHQMNLIMNLIIDLVMMNLAINLLKDKTVFY